MTIEVQPGDVLLVRNTSWRPATRLARWAIQIGAWLEHEPTTWTHVIVAHHRDSAGTFWGAEGRPGTVGWVDLAPHLADPVTLTNADQPKTVEQRKLICDAILPMIGTVRYDWATIAADGLQALGAAAENVPVVLAAATWVADLWAGGPNWGPGVPGHVVCSALADYAYERAGLASPAKDRFVLPADWALFIQRRGWS